MTVSAGLGNGVPGAQNTGKVGSGALGFNHPNRRAAGSQVAVVFPALPYDGCGVLTLKK